MKPTKRDCPAIPNVTDTRVNILLNTDQRTPRVKVKNELSYPVKATSITPKPHPQASPFIVLAGWVRRRKSGLWGWQRHNGTKLAAWETSGKWSLS